MKFNLQKSSGVVPRFPVWEVVALLYLVLYGISAMFEAKPSSPIVILLGGYLGAMLWYISLAVFSITSIIGLLMQAPNGLIVNLAGALGIFLSAFSVGAGLSLLNNSIFFSGNAGFWIFTLGGLLRSIQLFNQLSRMEKQVREL